MEPSTSVLLIDAGPFLRRLFETALASGDVAVVETHVDEAVARLRARPFDLVMLESASAERAIQQVRALRSVRGDAKVIVVSGDSAPDAALAAMREHAFAYFRSPFEPDEVERVIARALGMPDWQDGIEVISARPEWISLRLRCRRFTADRVLGFLAEMHLDLTAEDRESLGTAVREMLLNAIEHGGGLDPRQRVQVSRIRAADLILYHLVDPGSGFSFEALPHAAVSNPPDDPAAHVRHRLEHALRPGGFGILVTRNLVDELIYNECGNEVLLIKHLARAVPAPEPAASPPGAPPSRPIRVSLAHLDLLLPSLFHHSPEHRPSHLGEAATIV
jgi:anti-sigma regulatory factor (Ser/Thr protein kinase)/ActR/RegA family two-component response regulator